MASEPAPQRFKVGSEHTDAERLAVEMAQRRGLPVPRYETTSYRAAKASALEAAGLGDEAQELEAHAEGKPLADMSVAEHLRRLQQENPRSPGYAPPGHDGELPTTS